MALILKFHRIFQCKLNLGGKKNASNKNEPWISSHIATFQHIFFSSAWPPCLNICFLLTLYLFTELIQWIPSTTQTKTNFIKESENSVSLLHTLVTNWRTSKRINVEQKYILRPSKGNSCDRDTYMPFPRCTDSKKLYNVHTKTVLSTISLTISTLRKEIMSKDTGIKRVPHTDKIY